MPVWNWEASLPFAVGLLVYALTSVLQQVLLRPRFKEMATSQTDPLANWEQLEAEFGLSLDRAQAIGAFVSTFPALILLFPAQSRSLQAIVGIGIAATVVLLAVVPNAGVERPTRFVSLWTKVRFFPDPTRVGVIAVAILVLAALAALLWAPLPAPPP